MSELFPTANLVTCAVCGFVARDTTLRECPKCARNTSYPRPRRTRRLEDGVLGYFLASKSPTYAYLPDGTFVPSEGDAKGRACVAFLDELEFIDQEQLA